MGRYPKHLGELSLEEDMALIKTWMDIASAAISDPLVTWDIEPLTDCTYDIGHVDKQFQRLWLCQSLVFGEPDDYDDPATYLWYTKGSGYTELYLRVQEDTSGYARLYLRCNGTSGDYSFLRLESEGGGNSAEFTAKIGAGRGASLPQYLWYETSQYIYANVQLSGGLFLTTPSLSAFIDEAALGFYWRDSDPNKPAINGECAVWLSDGTATGAAGDLMCEIRAGGSTRTFTLVSHGAGAGNNVIDEYLYHAGDADTYLRFQTDQADLLAGGVGLVINGAGGLAHLDQSGAAAAIPVLHLEQDDVSEEFIRFTGQAASAVLTQSLVDVGDVGSFSPVGYLKINVQDEGDQVADGDYYVEFGTLS